MQPTHAHTHAHARHEHQHSVQLNFPEVSPPTLPVRRRSAVCTLGLIATALALLFLALIALEVPFIKFENRLLEQRMRAAPFQKDRTPMLNALPVTVGFWDERKTITALQLVVCLSLALDVDEGHITVTREEAHFYRATLENEGDWLLNAINDENSMFLQALNAQAARFGAQLVVSHMARKLDGQSTPPSPPSRSLTLPV